MAHHTGQPMNRINLDTERDFFMSGQQAKEYGLVDEVISTRLIKPKEGHLSGVESPSREA
jgi:ATP-dependent Clp protease protease subunit